MSAQWDPTSNKDQHFFHCFSFWWRWALGGVKDQKKQNSFQILVHIRICNFFFFFLSYQVFSFFHCVPSASLEESAQIERGASIHPSIHPPVCLCVCLSVCPSILFVPASGPAVSGAFFCFLFLFPASCLSVGGAVVVSVSSTQGRQGQSFGYVHIHGRSMASNKQQHYFRRSSTHTWDRGAEGLMCGADGSSIS